MGWVALYPVILAKILQLLTLSTDHILLPGSGWMMTKCQAPRRHGASIISSEINRGMQQLVHGGMQGCSMYVFESKRGPQPLCFG